VKYPIVIDAMSFRKETGFAHRFDELATARSFAEAFPARSRVSPVPPLG
jgi:hypothetical protein